MAIFKEENELNKKNLCVVIMITLTMIVNGNVFAASSSSSATLKQAEDNKKELQAKVQNLDKQIDEVIKNVDKNKKDMNKIAQDIKSTQLKLTAAENDSKAQKELFKKRARAMYINGADSYLSVILSSKGISDFISKTDMISTVVSFDNQIMNKLKEKQQAISKQKDALSSENSKLEALKTTNEKTLSKLNKEIKDQKELLAKANEKEKQLVAAATIPSNDSKNFKSGTLSRGMSMSAAYSKVLNMQSTAYSGDGVTASGTATKRISGGYSTIAVDPRVIPLGSTVYVEGYGYAVAEDTGGAIKGNIIDVFFPSEAEAQSWGRRSVTVYIIK